jgi:hypothetical protein
VDRAWWRPEGTGRDDGHIQRHPVPSWLSTANGQAGVENVLDILHGGLDSALLASGHASIHDLTPQDLVIPTNFTRELGV